MQTKQKKLGDLGEQCFHTVFPYVIRSDNEFDTACDFRDVFGHTYEIKTQTRHPIKNVFSISYHNETNKKKCFNVDHLIFVEYDDSPTITFHECVDRTNYVTYTTRFNKKTMIGFPIKEMKIIHTVYDPLLAQQMRDVSSDYRFKK